eukprot:6485480-Amphidinium_carterae.1
MLDGEGALFLVVTAMTSYAAESMVENVLADNRVASKYLEYREDAEHEIDSLQMVPKLLWSWAPGFAHCCRTLLNSSSVTRLSVVHCQASRT